MNKISLILSHKIVLLVIKQSPQSGAELQTHTATLSFHRGAGIQTQVQALLNTEPSPSPECIHFNANTNEDIAVRTHNEDMCSVYKCS